MYQTDISKQTITIEGRTYSAKEIIEGIPLYDHGSPGLNKFLEDWFNDSEEITIYTSGSTGQPKPINVKKMHMMQSASITCGFFNLKSGDKVLLCMSMNFIAGKMMVVRAIVAGLDLYPIEPSGHPLSSSETCFQFASMVPLQIYNSLQIDSEMEKLKRIGILLIGGGAIDSNLETALKDFTNKVYVSYGMTETLSHIALRRINGSEASLSYTPLPFVTISLSKENTLVINAPMVSDKILTTNDIAEINKDGSFRIFGRKDNIINTGGIKVQAETLETILGKYIKTPFAISSLPDKKFGEIIVLVVEQTIDKLLYSKHLPTYQRPKKIIQVTKIPLTESGKINRSALKKIIQSL